MSILCPEETPDVATNLMDITDGVLSLILLRFMDIDESLSAFDTFTFDRQKERTTKPNMTVKKIPLNKLRLRVILKTQRIIFKNFIFNT